MDPEQQIRQMQFGSAQLNPKDQVVANKRAGEFFNFIKKAASGALKGVTSTLDAIPPSVDLYPGPVDNMALIGLAGLNKGLKKLPQAEAAVRSMKVFKPVVSKVDDVAREAKQLSGAGGEGNLTQYIKNPKLYEKYPQLKNTEVVIVPKGQIKNVGYSGAGADVANNKIYIPEGSTVLKGPYKDSFIAHEVEHLIKGDVHSAPMAGSFYQNPAEINALERQVKYVADQPNATRRDIMKVVDQITGNTQAGKAPEALKERLRNTGFNRLQPPLSNLADEARKVTPLEGLAQEAKKHPTFESFKKAFLNDIHHGDYYHVTDNPNFKIDPNLGPRDMSSLAGGKMTKGAFMVTSDLPYWAEAYPERGYVAKIDLSKLSPQEYSQVNRGMGNEMFINDPSKVGVTKVMTKEQALKEAQRLQKALDKTIPNEKALQDFYNKAVSKKK